MSLEVSKLTFETQYGTPAGDLGVFQDNSTREISEADMRTFGQTIADSLFPLIVETTILAADFKLIGSVPVTLVASPGSGYYLTPYRVLLSKNVGSAVAFTFESPIIIKAGGETLYYIDGTLNIAGAINLDLLKTGIESVNGSALTITTEDGSNSGAGGSDVKIKVYYKIETAFI